MNIDIRFITDQDLRLKLITVLSIYRLKRRSYGKNHDADGGRVFR